MKMFTLHTLSLLLVALLSVLASIFLVLPFGESSEERPSAVDAPTVLVAGEIGKGDVDRDFQFQGWATARRSFADGKVRMSIYAVELPLPLESRVDRSRPVEIELGFGQRLKVPAKLVDGILEFTTFGDFADGLNITARMRLKPDANTWKVPLRSLVAPFGGLPQVWTEQNGKIRVHPVYVFATDLTHARVFSLQSDFLPSERVVIGGQQKVSSGSHVRAIQEGALK